MNTQVERISAHWAEYEVYVPGAYYWIRNVSPDAKSDLERLLKQGVPSGFQVWVDGRYDLTVGYIWGEARDNWKRGIEFTDEDLNWWDKWVKSPLSKSTDKAIRKVIGVWGDKRDDVELYVGSFSSKRPFKVAALRAAALRIASELPVGDPTRRKILGALQMEHINAIIRKLAAKFFGSREWAEVPRRDDTFALMFPDDRGNWPDRGYARFIDIPTLIRSKASDMSVDLVPFFKALDKTLRGYVQQTVRADGYLDMRGTNKVSLRWLDKNGESEEWSIDIGSEYGS